MKLHFFAAAASNPRKNPCATTAMWENATECRDLRMSARLTNRQFVCHALHPIWLSNLASFFSSPPSQKLLFFAFFDEETKMKKVKWIFASFLLHDEMNRCRTTEAEEPKAKAKKVLNYLMKETRKCFNLTICHFWWIANVYTHRDVRGSS